jgi:hypothetical protein
MTSWQAQVLYNLRFETTVPLIFVHPAKLDKEAVSVLLTRISSIPELSHEPKSSFTNKNSNTSDTNTEICASNSIT